MKALATDLMNKASSSAFGAVIILPGVLLLLLVQLYPLLYSLFISFHDYRLLRPELTEFVWLKNYIDIFSDAEFLNALSNTAIYVGLAIPIELMIGFVLALAIEKITRGKNLIRALLIVPQFMAPIAMGFVWRFLYNDEFGLINFMLRKIGIERPPLWLADPDIALYSCIIVEIWATVPIFMLLLSAGMASISSELIDAAKIDGANAIHRVRFIILPHLKPIILVALLIRGMDAFRVFDVVYSLTGGGPALSTDVLSLYLYRTAMLDRQFGDGASAAWIMMIMMLIASYVLIRTMYREGIKT
jgi:multiple sugar transport system permease protein|tara:strand:- start:56 stop:961 length:906 start_codon:yes stop_codon:yes gene_type:complete